MNVHEVKLYAQVPKPYPGSVFKRPSKVSNCCGAPPQGEVDKSGVGRCSKCKAGAVFEKSLKETKAGTWKVEIVFQNGSLSARNLSTDERRTFSVKEATEFTWHASLHERRKPSIKAKFTRPSLIQSIPVLGAQKKGRRSRHESLTALVTALLDD